MSILEISKTFKVKKGQITFNAEGNDIDNSPYFSRVIHWPGNSLSGVTIGRGYDMGNRTKNEVFQDLIKAGIPTGTAKALSEGAGIKGVDAKKFVLINKKIVNKISHNQQVQLFDNIYPLYESRAKGNYDKWTHSNSKQVDWNKLDQVIRDMLVDFVYQGFTRGPNPMLAGMQNDIDILINYINKTPAIKIYEAGRNRANYLIKAKKKG